MNMNNNIPPNFSSFSASTSTNSFHSKVAMLHSNKISLQQRHQWQVEVQSCAHRIRVLDKDVNSCITSILRDKNCQAVLADVEEEKKVLQKENVEQQQLFGKVHQIKEHVKILVNQLLECKNAQKQHQLQLQQQITAIEGQDNGSVSDAQQQNNALRQQNYDKIVSLTSRIEREILEMKKFIQLTIEDCYVTERQLCKQLSCYEAQQQLQQQEQQQQQQKDKLMIVANTPTTTATTTTTRFDNDNMIPLQMQLQQQCKRNNTFDNSVEGGKCGNILSTSLVCSSSSRKRSSSCQHQQPQQKQQTSSSSSSSFSEASVIAEVDRFVRENGGIYGGWEAIDHATFLKLRTQTKCKEELINRITVEIPFQNQQTAVAHLRWYENYSELSAKKHQAIEKWKAIRVAQQESYARLTEEKSLFEERSIFEQKKQQLQLEQAKKDKTKEMLRNWKEEQKLQRLTAAQLELQATEEEAKKRKQAFEEHKEEMREMLKEHKEKNQLNEEVNNNKKSNNNSCRLRSHSLNAAATPTKETPRTPQHPIPEAEKLKRYEQDLEIVKNRLFLMEKKDWKHAKQALDEKLAKQVVSLREREARKTGAPLIVRDFGRVLQPTQQSSNREFSIKYGPRDAAVNGGVGHPDTVLLRGINPSSPAVVRHTGRAMPAWRSNSQL